MNNAKTIPIADAQHVHVKPVPVAAHYETPTGPWIDALGRPLRDLRISVTDHCNFRCRYCMPKEIFSSRHAFLPQTELLTFNEIIRIARIALSHGVQKFRLTGGEPLLRKGIENLIAELLSLRTLEGKAPDVAITTNGSILRKKLPALVQAGLRRITISLDSLDEATFQKMNDVGFPAHKVLSAIDAAVDAGLQVKINTVVQRGVNERQIVPIAQFCRGRNIIPRYIEYMDVGSSNGWQMKDVISADQIVARIAQHWPVEPIAANYVGETANRWRYLDGQGEFGCIASVTKAFCRTCSRVRLSMNGRLFLCLFATEGYDIRTLLRGGASDEEIDQAIAQIWSQRTDRYSELRQMGLSADRPKIEMSYIGG